MNARGERTRSRLIAATTEVVGQVGYARATTRAIALAAGVAEGTIYRHFADKQDLFFAAVSERNAPIIGWLARLPSLAGSATVRENLRELLHQLGRLRSDLLPLELSLRADPALARDLRIAAAARRGPMGDGPEELVSAYLAAEQRFGRIRSDVDTSAAATVLLATLFGLAMLPSIEDHAVDPALIEVAIDLLLVGLGEAVRAPDAQP